MRNLTYSTTADVLIIFLVKIRQRPMLRFVRSHRIQKHPVYYGNTLTTGWANSQRVSSTVWLRHYLCDQIYVQLLSITFQPQT